MTQPSFQDLFDTSPTVRAAAPGRVNLIGDHTDYNGGWVLPAAIPQQTKVELARASGTRVRVWTSSFTDSVAEYSLSHEHPDGSWVDYVKGMTVVLRDAGVTGGFALRIESDVPPGGGLASSAALEIAVGRALRDAFTLPLNDIELAVAARRAENEFVGAPVGIMDQMACSLASESTALFLDTRSLEFERVALPDDAVPVVIDSGLTHRHAGGGYIQRRRECEEAAARLGVPELRDLPAGFTADGLLSPTLARRVRHVITENERVHLTVAALRAGDLVRAGALFADSHRSLRDDYEVSLPALDQLVELASHQQGVFGARLTGGGFGGAIVALARRDLARAAAANIVSSYNTVTGNAGRAVVPSVVGQPQSS
jgi:galactokinase